MKLALLLGLLLPLRSLGAQLAGSSWATEIVAGVASDAAARGPWMNPVWRDRLSHRVTFAMGLSLAYEYLVEPVNHQTNASRWQDVGQRLAGMLALELVWVGARRILR